MNFMHKFKCFNCGKEYYFYKFKYKEKGIILSKVLYRCPNCNQRYSLKINFKKAMLNLPLFIFVIFWIFFLKHIKILIQFYLEFTYFQKALFYITITIINAILIIMWQSKAYYLAKIEQEHLRYSKVADIIFVFAFYILTMLLNIYNKVPLKHTLATFLIFTPYFIYRFIKTKNN